MLQIFFLPGPLFMVWEENNVWSMRIICWQTIQIEHQALFVFYKKQQKVKCPQLKNLGRA